MASSLSDIVVRANQAQLAKAFVSSATYAESASDCEIHSKPAIFGKMMTTRSSLNALAEKALNDTRLIAKGKNQNVHALLKALDQGCYDALKLDKFDAFRFVFGADEVVNIIVARDTPSRFTVDFDVKTFESRLREVMIEDLGRDEDKHDSSLLYKVPLVGIACLSLLYFMKQ